MKKLYIKDWLAYQPYTKEGTADIFYMNLANQIQEKLFEIRSQHLILEHLETEDLRDLAVFLTSYFEDFISQTEIFKGFKNLNQDLYGKNLPFFEAENSTDDINLDDIQFLVWYFFNLPKQDFLFNPKNESFTQIAQAVFEILDESYEFAPENTALKTYFSIKDEHNFDEVRYFFDKLFTKSFLLKYDTAVDFHFKSQPLMQDSSQAGFQRYKSFRDYYTINQKTKLLGLRSCEWAAAMNGENAEFSKALKNLSENQQNVFRFIELDGKNLKVEHLVSGKIVTLAGDNFTEAKKLPPNALFSAGICRWEGKYVITGILWVNTFDEKIADAYRNQFPSAHLFETEVEIENRKNRLAWEENYFKQQASHSFFHLADVSSAIDFINDFYAEVEKHHEINQAQVQQMLQQVNLKEKVRNFLIFYNEKEGLEFYFNLPEGLEIENNPFFIEKNGDFLLKLMMSEEISGELFKALKNNFSFDSELNAYNPQDQDFLLRFFKPNRHHQ